MSGVLGANTLDGRRTRGVRTRQALVDALFALVTDGDLAPTAGRIAERAGISERSIYQHFDGMESLFRAASERQLELVAELYDPIPADLPTGERVKRFVVQRARIHEAVTPIRRAALLQEHTSNELRQSRDRFMALGRADVSAVFAKELARLDPDDRQTVLAALHAASGWNCWDWLRMSGLSVKSSREAMQRTVAALVGTP